ncbi:MAG: cytochrome d ubiquinol oxidase subunit II [Mucinivorans sp.]
MEYICLQHYWWLIVSLLAAILVFLFFVQGGQAMLRLIGKTENERTMIINVLGRKWEFTFTTLVTFGGAFFASFPLFYSTSFGGAYYVWMAILLVFVIQAVSYEFRGKAGNFLGRNTYDTFLMINGLLAPLLIGVAVGTFFTGANFTVDMANIGSIVGGGNMISQWDSPWHGLEALADYRNVLLGLAVAALALILGLMYFINTIDCHEIVQRSRKMMVPLIVVFLITFLSFVATTSAIEIVFEPVLLVLFLIGVVLVLFGFYRALVALGRNGIWFSGLGTVVTVLSLLLFVGYTGSYYPSLTNPESSLTIFNSSSSEFTLKVMSYVSIAIPFVLAYICFAWRAMNKKRITVDEISDKKEHLY